MLAGLQEAQLTIGAIGRSLQSTFETFKRHRGRLQSLPGDEVISTETMLYEKTDRALNAAKAAADVASGGAPPRQRRTPEEIAALLQNTTIANGSPQ